MTNPCTVARRESHKALKENVSFPSSFYLLYWLTFAVTAKKEMELIAMLVA